MFELSRRSTESVIVDGFSSPKRALKVTVLEIKDGRVRLGFEVNKEVPVRRTEIWKQIRDGNGTDLPDGRYTTT